MKIADENNITIPQGTINRKDRTGGSRYFAYDAVRTVLTWTIVLTHALTTAKEQGLASPSLLQDAFAHISGGIGQVAVFCFFLFSGLLIHKNRRNDTGIMAFYKDRAAKMLVPIVICSLPLIAVDVLTRPEYFVESAPYVLNTFVFNFLGLDLYLWSLADTYPYHVAGEWFTSVILTMYALYPLLRKGCSNRKKQVTVSVIVIVVYLANIIYPVLTKGDGVFSFGRGLLFFWSGMLLAEYEDLLKDRRIFIVSTLGFLILYAIHPIRFLFSTKLANTTASYCAFVMLIGIGERCSRFKKIPLFKNFIEGTCRNSYMIYLCHHFILQKLMPVFLTGRTSEAFCLFVPASALLIYLYSALMNALTKPLIRLILKRKNA